MNLQFKRRLDSSLSRWLIGLHMLLARLLGSLLRRDHSVGKAPDTILFVKILGLGSVFIAGDAIAALRQRYPQARFVILCGRGLEKGLQAMGIFDEVWVVNDSSLTRLVGSTLSLLWRSWRLRGTLWTADLEVYSKLTPLFCLWTCARNRFGFQLEVVRFRRNLNTHSVYFNRFVPIQQNYLQLAQAMGAAETTPLQLPGYTLPRPAPGQPYPFIAINNTCSDLSLERKLPDVQLQIVLSLLLEHTPYTLVLVGAPSDRAAYDAFLQKHPMGERVQNMAGSWTFDQYYHTLYHQCAAMVSIDSAPLHIARALGLPVFSFWGPTNPQHYLAPRSTAADEWLYLGVHCSPCVHYTEELPCGGNNFCMRHMEKSLISPKLLAFVSSLPA